MFKLKNILKSLTTVLAVATIMFVFTPISTQAKEVGNTTMVLTVLNPIGGSTPLSPIAEDDYDSPGIDGRDSLYENNDEARAVHNSYIDTMPAVSTNDILKWATTKGNEIIYFLQIIIQPFAIIIFIIAAFMSLIGSIGRGDMVGKGVWAMITSVLCYAAVLYAPVILQTFVGWISS